MRLGGVAWRLGARRFGGRLRAVAMLLACVGLAGCETVGYYGQAVRGQLEILAGRQRIDDLLQQASTPEPLRVRLRLVQAAREFASTALGLPVGERYTSYVDLGRPYAVWNVFATPELSLTPREWCYPIAGCAVYRGYFDRADAEAFAATLRAEGEDVHVGGVVAYSTLGWFDDPVLSSFDSLREEDLVGLVFHETAHSLVYVPGDSRFNEGYATFVEEEGLRQWYATAGVRVGGEAASAAGVDTAAAVERVRHERAVRAAFLRFVLGHRDALAALYAQQLPAAEMRARKAALFAHMRVEYASSTDIFAGRYDRFFGETLNNARLVTFSTYHDWVPAFAELHRRAGSWPAFHAQVRALADDDAQARTAKLDALLASARSRRAADDAAALAVQDSRR
jgi:predicted aminopeptidase